MDFLGFGERLKEYRTRHNLTQLEMAEMMGVSKNHFSMLERGEKIPRAATVEKFHRLACEDEVSRCAINTQISPSERREYAKLLSCLDKVDTGKRTEAIDTFIRLLQLM